jgi:hypothetical protein
VVAAAAATSTRPAKCDGRLHVSIHVVAGKTHMGRHVEQSQSCKNANLVLFSC